jgi:hypothetical protein
VRCATVCWSWRISGLRLRRAWGWARRRRVPSHAGTLVLLLFLWGALDDVTSGSETDHRLDWLFVALTSGALLAYWTRRRWEPAVAVLLLVLATAVQAIVADGPSGSVYAWGALVSSGIAAAGFWTGRSGEKRRSRR